MYFLSLFRAGDTPVQYCEHAFSIYSPLLNDKEELICFYSSEILKKES